MLPMVEEEATELDDYLGMVGLNFNDISSLASDEDFLSDNTRLEEDNPLFGLLSQQPSAVVQPASPRPQPSLQKVLTPAPLLQQAMSPKPGGIQVQPLSSPQLEQPQLYANLKILTASLADSVLCLSSVCQLGQEPSSLAFQQASYSRNKRGDKPTYSEGMVSSRRRRSTKPKAYEMQPVLDEDLEKKRRNAVTAKKHRDMQKEERRQLSDEVATTLAERDRLLQVLNQCKQREQHLLQALSGRGIKVDPLYPSLDGF